MQKWVIILLSILLAVVVIGGTVGVVAIYNTFYSDDVTASNIKSDVAILDSDGNVILDNADIKKVRVKAEDESSFLELIFSKNGQRKYNRIIKELLDKDKTEEIFEIVIEGVSAFSYTANEYVNDRVFRFPEAFSPEDAVAHMSLFQGNVIIEPSPDEPTAEKKMNEDDFIKFVKKQLGVPEDAVVTYEFGTKYTWGAGGDVELISVIFKENGELVASADVATASGEVVRSINNYIAPEKPSAEGYFTYSNSKGGYSVDVPNGYTKLWEEGSDVGFYSPEGDFDLQVYSYDLPAGVTTLDQLYDEIYYNLDFAPTYEHKGSDFFVISGISHGSIAYLKYKLNSNGKYTWLKMIYSPENKTKFDGIVTHISGSLK